MLAHLRCEARWWRFRATFDGPYAEAMAALNAADRQSDDDQICGC